MEPGSSECELIPKKMPFQPDANDWAATRREQARCLRIALRIVERFSQPGVTQNMVERALPWLEREQYDDIAIERNADGLCGYALCERTLERSVDKRNQLYRICMRSKRVFDVSERRRFCSDWCYTATTHLRNQIPNEPAWCRASRCLRDGALTLLSRDAPVRPGPCLLDAAEAFHIHADEPERSDASDASESDTVPPANVLSSSEYEDEEEEDVEVLPEPPAEIKVSDERKMKLIDWDIAKELHAKLKLAEKARKVETALENSSLVDRISERIKEWITRDSVWTLLRMEANQDEASRLYAQRVLGSFSREPENPTFSGDNTTMPAIIPLVDHVAQSTVQRQLIIDSLQQPLRPLWLKAQAQMNETSAWLRRLIDRFSVHSRNIHLGPSEAKLVAYVLLFFYYRRRWPATISVSEWESSLKADCDLEANDFMRLVELVVQHCNALLDQDVCNDRDLECLD